jgi:hypothetical protein
MKICYIDHPKDNISFCGRRITPATSSTDWEDVTCDECNSLNVKLCEAVNHPSHYTGHPSGVECITVTEHMNFNLGNAMKYIWRADLKDKAIEDLKKAEWYIQRELKRRSTDV